LGFGSCNGGGDNGGDTGGSGTGDYTGDTPVNQGAPFVFQENAGTTPLPDFELEIDPLGFAYLRSGGFSRGGRGAAPNKNCMVVNGTTVCKSSIDIANLMELGKTSYRDALPFCSTHVTVNNSTGQVDRDHPDLFNPQGSIPSPPGIPNVPLLPFHLLFDALPDAIYRVTGSYILPAGRNHCS
jgi:hypothetical protein